MLIIFECSFSQGIFRLTYYVTPNDTGKLVREQKNVVPQTRKVPPADAKQFEVDIIETYNKIASLEDASAPGTINTTVIPICNTLRGFIKLDSNGKCVFEPYGITQNRTETLKYNGSLPPPPIQCLTSTTPHYKTYISLPTPATFGSISTVQYLKFTSLNYGVSTLAARFRGDDNNGRKVVSGGLGAGLNITFTRGFAEITPRKITHWYLSAGLFSGLATTELNVSNVDNSFGWPTTDKRTNATINYGPCIILGRQNFGLLFTYGWERALGADGEKWIYNNKPWFGIGVSSSLGFF
ncbi:MAG: hypothetical protein J0L86_05450 [Flavobacteriales bacterium]|nr:hypothetical protein [Flavobacteriales bacterium]